MGNARKYPALRASVLMAMGIVVGDGLGLSVYVSAVILLFLLISGFALLYFRNRSSFADLLRVLVFSCLCAAFGAAKIAFDRDRPAEVPPRALESEVILMGTVDDLPVRIPNGIRFVMNTSSIVIDRTTNPFQGSVLVSLTRLREGRGMPVLRHGNYVAVYGELIRPAETRNPGEFSERQYYDANGISLLLRASGEEHVVILDPSEGTWLMSGMVEPARQYIVSSIDMAVGGEEGEFLKGLLIGERNGMSPATRRAFTHAGVAHVLAVSGSNVAVVAAILFVLAGFLPFPRWVRFLLVAGGILFYMLLTGSQPPVVRATIMALVILAADAFQEKRNPYNALGLAACIIFLIDARQLFDVGFQLSFAAVLSILALYPKVNAWIARFPSGTFLGRMGIAVLQVAGVSAVATVGTFPLTAIYFGKVSIIGVLANVFVLPMVGAGVALGCAGVFAGLVSPWLAGVYGAVNHVLLSFALTVTTIAGNLPLAYVDSARFTALHAIPCYLVLFLLVLARRTAPFRVFCILLLVSLNVMVFTPGAAAYAVQNGFLRLSVIDVGQGDAILVEFPDGNVMLVDAGPGGLSYDAGDRVVAPFLRRRGISTIDLLVVSHPHADHLGGVPALLEQFDVRRVADNGEVIGTPLYARYLARVRDERCKFDSPSAGSPLLDVADARVYILAPMRAGDEAGQASNLNNTSIVCKIQYGNIAFLLSGDAEEEAEQEIAERYGDFLRADVLKAGHHGSSTSSTSEFLTAVRPSHVVISVGRRNKFGHPAPSVVERIATLPARIHRTDDDGAVIFQTDGVTLSQIDWR